MVPTLKFALFALCTSLAAAAFAQTPPQPTCTITATPATAAGQADVTVTWSTTNCVLLTASGTWSGTKDCAGGSQVMQDVTQNRTFNLTARGSLGRLVYTWTRPLLDTEGNPTTIGAYRLFVASTPAGVPTAAPIVLPADPLTHTLYKTPGAWSGGIKAVDTANVPSGLSNIVTKQVAALAGTCSATVTITPRPRTPVLSQLVAWFKTLGG